jgi:hypothetical protein
MVAAELVTLRHSWPSGGADAADFESAELSLLSLLSARAAVEAEFDAEDDGVAADCDADDGEFEAGVDAACEGESLFAGAELDALLDALLDGEGDGEGEGLGDGLADGVLKYWHTPPAADAREVKASACATPGTPTDNRTPPPIRPAATVRTRTKHI